ncbi:Glycogen synthase [Bacillus sp. THAF10]|uniref:glycosyltransferase family 4 protein n=1 Tax=Bacillus sp. THAF10 TaxID=2587848 RepID=UPI001268971B|nr:glycosyltransferase family 4 protein [Bacillus sp. THAF10]QFT89842.1 Glycogen synthase [Bacillus sp. THAF10]
MEEKKQQSEFLLVRELEKGDIEITWSIYGWRFDCCAFIHGECKTLTIRLVAKMKKEEGLGYFLEIKDKNHSGNLRFTETIPGSVLLVEIGVGEGEEFIPLLYSETEIRLSEQKEGWSTSWREIRFADSADLHDYLSVYSYYIGEESQPSQISPPVERLHVKEKRSIQQVENRCLSILMLSWEYPPFIQGGLGRHVLELSKQLAVAGHKVTVVTHGVYGAPRQEEVDGVTVYRTDEFSPIYKGFHLYNSQINMKLVELVMTLLPQQEFNLIHAHDWQVGSAARYLKKIANLPLITTIHALENGRSNLEKKIQQQIDKKEKLLITESDELIVCSSYMEGEILEKGITSQNVCVIPNGVELSSVESDSLKTFIQKYHDYKIILFLGRLVPEKGVDTLIKAASFLKKSGHNIKYVIAGNGPLLSFYRMLVREQDLEEHFLFVGFLHDHEKTTMLKLCDILVIPSLYEPFGIVALEGMATGKPILAAKTGGLVEIIEEGKSGLFFSPGVEKELADRLLYLLNNKEHCIALGKYARQRAEQCYRWDDVRKQTESVYWSFCKTASSIK